MRTEFEFIHHIKKTYGLSHIGDDCAVLPKDEAHDLVITADLLVEDIDFRLDWTTPELIGQKALAVSLSDIAAMGGKPSWAMTTIAVPRDVWDSDFVERFYVGWTKIATHYDVELVGGDISRTPDKIVIDSIVGGETPKGKAILRSGAKPGDAIFVTGTLGGAAQGLILLETGVRYKDAGEPRRKLIGRQLRPTPRVEAGQYLMDSGLASAMIDISDGLSSDLHHLCAASGVGARLDYALIPVDPNLESISLSPAARVGAALNGGEDFELLFTVPKQNKYQLELPDITCIGEVTPNPGIIEIVADGERSYLPERGYAHF